MKRFFTLLSVLLISYISNAQLYYGIVKDFENQPIPFANVIAQDGGGKLLSGVITNEAGEFEIELTTESFTLIVSFVGFQNWKKDINSSVNSNLGIIHLVEEVNNLHEVVINSNRPTIVRKVDRLEFNVANSILSSGGDAFDVLQKTPGVRAEGDDIALIGKSHVRILINGRLSPLSGDDLVNFLRSLSSENIQKIEVITNPPAKYEAEGNSGLINIVLKKNGEENLSGNIRSSYKLASYPTVFVGTGLNYQKNKWSVFGDMNLGNGSIEVSENNKMFFTDQTWDTESKIRYYTKLFSGRGGIDYDISDNTSMGFQYIGSTSSPDNKEYTTTKIIGSNSIDSLLITNAPTNSKVYYHSLNGHFKTVFDTIGRELTIDLDYFVYHNNQDRLNTTKSYENNEQETESSTTLFSNISGQVIKTLTLGLDMEYPTDYINLNFGGKATRIKNHSEVKGFDLNDPDSFMNQINNFRYTEETQALYASANKNFNKWELKIGLRYEFTKTEGYSFTLEEKNVNNYNKAFPTAYITYNANDNNAYSLNYGKRINRPGFSSLNPFRWYSNPYSYTEGNPFLQPSFTDNLEFSHIYKSNLNTSVYASLTKNGSDQITLTDDITNIQATVRRNFLKEYALGITQSYSFNHFNWLQSYLQYDFNYLKVESQLPNTIAEQEGVNFYSSINNSIFFNTDKTLVGELNFWYASPSISGVDRFSARHSTNIGFRCLMFSKSLQMSLIASDVFRTNISKIKSIVNNMNQEYNNYYDNRQVRFTLIYKFGNQRIRNKRKEFSNEEERSRAE